jgi:xanthine/CO dehydrogenase XdhC/CoxF family maturation factor/CTP:molybdopterin cytidylyltransferase MocA
MKNIYSILSDELEKNVPLAIATIVETKGSTPQVQGVSAVFSANGLISGTLGGGILEAEAQDRARQAISEKVSILYESNLDAGISEDESAICGGKAMILIDASPQKHSNVFHNINNSLKKRQPGVLATFIDKYPEGKTEIVRHWVRKNNIDDFSLEAAVIEYKEEIKKCLEDEISLKIEKTAESALFLEPVLPHPQLIIAGAGHIGQAVTHLSSLLGFEVMVIDERPEYCNKEKCPDADHLVVDNIGKAAHEIPKTPDTYIVIVTRGHKYDAEVLRQCMDSDVAYIGMIGSRRKIRLMRRKFLDEGWATPDQFDRVHAPIGIEIGSKTIQEIAVSICAQLILIRNQKTGRKQKTAISAIILAAGESRRMGSPKLLLPYLDKTIIEKVIEQVLQSEVKHIIVVLGSEKDKIRNQIRDYPVIIAENPDYQNGMLSSIQTGLRALPDDTDAVMLLLGDQPMVTGPVIDQLTDTYRHSDKGIFIAVHKEKRGHPIIIKIKYRKEIEQLTFKNSMHDFTRKFAQDILEVETGTQDILRDIDTPEDYHKEIKYRRLS